MCADGLPPGGQPEQPAHNEAARSGAGRRFLHVVEEFDEAGEVGFLVVVHGQVAAVRAVQVPAAWQAAGHHLHVRGIHRVVAGADHQRRHVDRCEVAGPIPVGELGAGADPEFARALHRHVDRRVDVGEAALHRIGPVPGRHAQHVMDVVLLGQQLHVPGVLDLPAGLQRLDLGQRRLVHLRHQHLLGVGVVGGDAGHHVRDDEPPQMLLVVQGVLDGEEPAPRLAVEDEVVPAQPERDADLVYLIDETVQLPQRRVGGLIAEARAKLVIVVVLDPRRGQVAVAGLQVLVGRPRPAVQQQHPEAGIVADPLHPHPEGAGRRPDRDHSRAPAQHVVPVRTVQIGAHRPTAPPSPGGRCTPGRQQLRTTGYRPVQAAVPVLYCARPRCQPGRVIPAIRYCATPAGRVAYSTDGAGPPLLCDSGWITHLRGQLELFSFASFMARLAERYTVIRYDKPGCGLSDRDGIDLSFDGQVAAALAVADAARADRFSVFGASQGGQLAAAIAARCPERVEALVLYGTCASGADLAPAEVRDSIVALVRAHWGLGSKVLTGIFIRDPSAEEVETFTRLQRAGASADVAGRLLEV